MAPEPEGPDEVYRRFERLNRRGLSGGAGGLRKLAETTGKRTLYGAFAVVETAAIVLGLFLDVPFMDTVAFVLPGLLIMFHGGLKARGTSEAEGEPEEESLLDGLRKLLRDRARPLLAGEAPHRG